MGLLLAGTVLPVVLFAAVVVVQLTRDMKSDIERRLLQSGRSMAAAVDRELIDNVEAFEVLAKSASLTARDLETFRIEAQRVRELHPAWLTVLLINDQGQQVLNLEIPDDGLPAPLVEPESYRRVVEEGSPTLGSVRQDPSDAVFAFPVRVPVFRDGRLRYVLTAVIPVESLANLMARSGDAREELTRVARSEGERRNEEALTLHTSLNAPAMTCGSPAEGHTPSVTVRVPEAAQPHALLL